MRRDLKNVTLVCPDKDAESRLILLLAYSLGMCVIRSSQGLGATLDRERGDLPELIRAAGHPEVWIVEIPGPEIEKELRRNRIRVVIIDHHSYGKLDRSRDEQGNLLPSSLEQFMALAQITDQDLIEWRFDPVVVRGIAVMDAGFVQALRERGYTHEQICRLLDFRRKCERAGNPRFEEAEAAAREAWKRREQVGSYIVVASTSPVGIRGAISEITIYENCDTVPLVIVDKNGEEIFVQNVDPSVTLLLKSTFPEGFTFGEGRCWGVNNEKSRTHYTLDHILGVLS